MRRLVRRQISKLVSRQISTLVSRQIFRLVRKISDALFRISGMTNSFKYKTRCFYCPYSVIPDPQFFSNFQNCEDSGWGDIYCETAGISISTLTELTRDVFDVENPCDTTYRKVSINSRGVGGCVCEKKIHQLDISDNV
jgi:hypothetical protein